MAVNVLEPVVPVSNLPENSTSLWITKLSLLSVATEVPPDVPGPSAALEAAMFSVVAPVEKLTSVEVVV